MSEIRIRFEAEIHPAQLLAVLYQETAEAGLEPDSMMDVLALTALIDWEMHLCAMDLMRNFQLSTPMTWEKMEQLFGPDSNGFAQP